MKRDLALNEKDKLKYGDKQMQEFRDRMMNYSSWRWSKVSLYQSIFIVFVTAAILILLDIISKEDLILKFFVLVALIFFSFKFYKHSLGQTQKQVIVTTNMIGTLEHGPKIIKGDKGMDYAVIQISDFIHEDEIKRKKKQHH